MSAGAPDCQAAETEYASRYDDHGAMTRDDDQRLLLLSPSAGLGGGIERVMDAIHASWRGPTRRIDLLPEVSARDQRPPSLGEAVRRTAILRFTASALGSARGGRPDVVVCGLLGLLPAAAAVALTFRAKLALVAHGLEVWGHIPPLERVLIRRCTHVLCVSSFTADMLGKRAGVDTGVMRTLALPMAESIAVGAQGEVPDQTMRPPLVLTVSRLSAEHRYKGHFDIARCFARVLDSRPDAQWVIVGDGDDVPALRAECDRLGINDAVTFRGRISDEELVELYQTAALFALPSFADVDAEPPVGEGFGLVYLEAGAFGLPIIAAKPGGGSADFVLDEQTGITVSPRAPDELADAILRLLNDPQLRTDLGQRARSRAFASHLPMHFQEALHASLR